MNRCGNRHNQEMTEGFTLLEILIALFIFAMVASAIFTAYRGTLSMMAATESQEDLYQMARIAAERITGDLESAYFNGEEPSSETDQETPDRVLFQGERKEIQDVRFSELRFVSLAHLTFSDENSLAQPAEISYYAVAGSEEGQLDLYRSDTSITHERPESGSGGVLLCRGLSAIDFVYYNAGGEAHESWDSYEEPFKGELPTRVTILLEFPNRGDPDHPLRFTTGVALPMGG